MLTLLQAREIADLEIKKMKSGCKDLELTIVDDLIIEKPYAWIFRYTSKKYLETSNPSFAIAGNSPFFISKVDGKISTYRTGLSINGMISEYEEENNSWNLLLTSDIYSDTKKLFALKKILEKQVSEMADFKYKKTTLLASGSKIKLLEVQRKLFIEDIKTELALRKWE